MKKIYPLIILLLITIGSFADVTIYAPALSTPADNATERMPDVLLDWEAVAGIIGIHYELQLSVDPAFATSLEIMTELTSYHASELFFGTQYYWRVKAIDDTGESDWSEVWSFTVIEIVELDKPRDGKDDQDVDVTLKWDPFSGITYYQCELDITADFNSPQYEMFEIPAEDGAEVDTEYLLFGLEYFWRVRAIHSKDTTVWSETWSFETMFDFKLKKPNDNATDRMPDVTLKWDDVDGVVGYYYQLALDPDFTLPITYEADTYEVTADTLDFGTEYYWRVMAFHFYDTTDWMDSRSFTTVDEVFLSSPNDEAVSVSIRPTLKWENLSGVLSYELQLADNEDFNNPMGRIIQAVPDEIFGEYRWTSPALDSSTYYYWRLKASHHTDISDWSEVWSFLVGSVGINDPVLSETTVKIFPNPSNGPLNISMNHDEESNLNISIIDLVGQEVFVENVSFVKGSDILQLKVNHLSNGIYMIRLQNDKNTYTKKLIIRK